jgi:hypothetical protein
MINIKYFLVTYDRLYDKVIDQLDDNELEKVYCYQIQKKVPKQISGMIQNNVKEWELEWNDYQYQTKQFYEYGSMIHLLNNPKLVEDLTHIGILHYDIIFQVNSINEMMNELKKHPNTIYYQKRRGLNDLYLSRYELDKICEFMGEKLNMRIDSNNIWNNGFISEALSLTPKPVFMKFAKYLQDNRQEIEDILIKNRWGIMNRINHRVCGIVERMWGFYLVSCGLPLKQMNVIHDWDSYIHKHSSEKNWITS